MSLVAFFLTSFILSGVLTDLFAEDAALPYSRRTQGYSGWSSSVRGDIRTLGIAGATVGLADSFIASGENPAGLALTLGGTQTQVSANRVHDGDIQNYNEPLLTSNLGLAASIYPWGFSAGYWSPQYEGQSYLLSPGSSQTLFNPEVLTQEFRLSAARLFYENKLSVGVGLTIGRSTESLSFPESPSQNLLEQSYALGASAGILYQLPNRLLLGLSGTLPMHYRFDSAPSGTPGIQNFFQPVKSPPRLGLGCGWIPNRFFRIGASLLWFGSTDGVALLSDTSRAVGQNATLQPRLGAEYLMAEFKELKIHLHAGTYLEVSRLANTPSRLHATGGLEVKAWILSLGWGVDEGPRYENFIYSAGIDVVKLLRKLDLIPPEKRPPQGGWIPDMTFLSDDGLARPLVAHWEDRYKNPNILEISEQLPERLQNKIQQTGKDLEGLGKEIGKELKGIGDGLIDVIEFVPDQIGKELKLKKKEPEPRPSP